MKRFATFLLALIMIMSLATTAFAEGENNTITINNTKNGETYALYKMFDLVDIDDSTDPATYTYKVNAAWEDFFAEDGAGAQYITKNPYNDAVTIVGEDKAAQEANAAALAKAAATWTGKPEATEETKAVSATVAFENLADGYWLVTSTLGTKAMAYTTPVNPAVEIMEKNEEPTIEKLVQEDSTGNWGKENDAQIGDTVNFKSTVKIVKGARNVVVHDKMDTGLTWIPASYGIRCEDDANLKDSDYNLDAKDYTVNSAPDDGDTFDITFSQEWIDGLDFGDKGYVEVEIIYYAFLNEYPVSNGYPTVSQNTTYVSYGDKSKSENDTTTTTTHYFRIFKHAAGSTEHLAGATFKLVKGTGENATVVKLIQLAPNRFYVANVYSDSYEQALENFTTVAEGEEEYSQGENADVYIYGVDTDDDYTLVEISAPEGYNKLKDPIKVTVNADNSTRMDVANQSGTELPSTGGAGTTMFYIFGGILVLAAVVLLVTKKRMAVAE